MHEFHQRRDFLHLLLTAAAGCAGAGLVAAEAKEAIPEAKLKAAGSYSTKRGGAGLLIKQHGKVVFEEYGKGGGKNTPKRIYSGTKAFWCIAALAAAEDDIIDLDGKVADTITEWQGVRGKDKVTLNQLLHFTAGLERGLKIHNDGLSDRNALALSRPMVATPGESFIYGPSQLQVVHEVLKRKLAARGWRKETPTRYLERRVLRPMGLGSQRYIPDAKGNPLLAAGFMMTASQWSRMGDLLLRSGAPVLKKDSFDRLTKGSSANGAYAFGVWNNRAAGRRAREVDVEDQLERDWHTQSWSRACLCRDAPEDLLACIGSGYNRLFVVPSRDLIVVRQSQSGRFSDAEFLRLLLA